MSDPEHNHAPVLAGTATPSRLSADLAALRARSAGQSLTVDELEKALKGRGFAMLLLLLALPFGEAFFRGVLCNVLVCLAVWLAMAGRTVTDKILAIILPIAAFVAAGFEHSVANMYFIPLGIFLHADIGVADMLRNLIPVTLGNLAGGAGMVGLVYHTIYRRIPPSAGGGR